MNQLEKFFNAGVQDQVSIMGTNVCLVSMPDGARSADFVAVVTARNGDLQLEYSGALYTVSAHALIPLSAAQVPRVGNHLISGDNRYIIVSVVRSALDQAFSCELVSI